MSHVITANNGTVFPLCNKCQTKDCSHYIETKSVSIMGVRKTWRLIIKGNDFGIIVSCDGYSE